ncbi:MAG: hypothetical protein ACKO7Z_05490 [Cyanobacteriota bacterium]
MSLLHCPLCIGLAVLSLGRGLAHAVLFWQWRALPARAPQQAPPAPPQLQPA